ncbi:MFS transporter [Streptomyces sp. SID8379]|uniref:MFS transporter n=1 Tax=Streptomyces sp. SID8379 TaxID=2690359 RepID=UPI00036B28DD|nr:MFS transporter [Streptomyces sp. HmicA12]MYW68598.1 MFS transporter [Streptomyces sp. SID8379]
MTSSADAPSTPSKSPRRPAWAGRNYTLLATSAFITALGANGALIASAFAVLESGGDGGDVGLVAAARTLFLVIFLLVGGAVADRLPRHHVMVAANALNFFSQGAFALLVLMGDPQLWQMMVLSALGGMGQAFFSPAAEGMLMASVTGEQASRAFALFRMAMSGAAVAGAALGGALVAAFGPGWVLAVDAAAFAVAGALRCFLDVSHIAPREPGGGLLSDMRDGWREFVSRPWLWGIVAQFSVVVAVVGAAEAVFGPLVARDELGGAGPWGFALGAFGVGTILGGLLMMRWKPKRLLFAATLSVFSLALPSAALAVPVPLPALVAVMFVSGVTIEIFGVSWITALHQEIPEEKLSRVSAYDWFGSVAMVPIATALAGPAESAFGRSASLWGCAALVVVATTAVLFVPDVRRLRRRESTPITGDPAAGRADVVGVVDSVMGAEIGAAATRDATPPR